jgi:hypothetical protein
VSLENPPIEQDANALDSEGCGTLYQSVRQSLRRVRERWLASCGTVFSYSSWPCQYGIGRLLILLPFFGGNDDICQCKVHNVVKLRPRRLLYLLLCLVVASRAVVVPLIICCSDRTVAKARDLELIQNSDFILKTPGGFKYTFQFL